MVYNRSLQKSEIEFLKDMLYESISIPENKPNKEKMFNAPEFKKYYEGWGRQGDHALISVRRKPSTDWGSLI